MLMLLALEQWGGPHPFNQANLSAWLEDAFGSYCLKVLSNEFYPRPALCEPQFEAQEMFRTLQGNLHQSPTRWQSPGKWGPQDSPALTWGYLSAGSTRLSMARTKAAVFPVPDWDWAIRFCGLDKGRREMKIILVKHTKRCQDVLSG